MQIDFSQVDTSVIDGMALTFAIFAFGTITILTILAGLMARFRFPSFIARPIITFAALGCIYYWAKYFLS